MAAITKQTPGLASLLPGPGEQLPDGNVNNVALVAGDIVYLTSAGYIAKAIATDGTAVTDKAIGIVPKDYAINKPVTIHNGPVSYHYAEEGTLTPGSKVYLSGSVAGGLNTAAFYVGAPAIGYVERNGGSVRFYDFRN